MHGGVWKQDGMDRHWLLGLAAILPEAVERRAGRRVFHLVRTLLSGSRSRGSPVPCLIGQPGRLGVGSYSMMRTSSIEADYGSRLKTAMA